MMRKFAESVVPGGPLIGVAMDTVGNILKHPIRTGVSMGTAGLLGFGIVGAWQGKFETSIEVKQSTTVESAGRGSVVAIDLDIPELPIVGFTTEVTGVKTVLKKEFRNTILGIEIPDIPAGTNWLTMDTTVDTVISHNSDLISAVYDPGLIEDETDDRIILKIPTEGFIITNHIDTEKEDPEFHGDWLTFPKNYATALATSFDGIKDMPGIGTLDKANSQSEKTLLGVTRASVLAKVAEVCAPVVMQDPEVNAAARANIINLAPLAIRDSVDPAIIELKDNNSATFVENLEVELQVGTEAEDDPTVDNMQIDFENPYTQQVEEYKKNPDIELETPGKFECEISDEVKINSNKNKVIARDKDISSSEAQNE